MELRKLTLKKSWKHLKIVNRHKWEVFKACAKAGHPIQGILHDLSKYSPTEFIESAQYQTDGASPVWAAREAKGYSAAWQHHKGANPHHWEYWTAGYRPDFSRAIKIPFKYIRELFCDYMGAGIAYSKNGGPKWSPQGAKDYWEGSKPKSSIHPHSVKMIDIWYELLLTEGLNETLKRLDNYKNCYEKGELE